MNKEYIEKVKQAKKVDVQSLVNVKEGSYGQPDLSYLSWADAWGLFLSVYPDATYKIIKNENNIPYFADDCGAIVYTEITACGVTHGMWLSIMDSSNQAMGKAPREITFKSGKTKRVDAFTMNDVNKTLMRCFTKNMAMFGLGLNIYCKEDLPIDFDEVLATSQPNDLSKLKKEFIDNRDLIEQKYYKGTRLEKLSKEAFEKVVNNQDKILDLIKGNSNA